MSHSIPVSKLQQALHFSLNDNIFSHFFICLCTVRFKMLPHLWTLCGARCVPLLVWKPHHTVSLVLINFVCVYTCFTLGHLENNCSCLVHVRCFFFLSHTNTDKLTQTHMHTITNVPYIPFTHTYWVTVTNTVPLGRHRPSSEVTSVSINKGACELLCHAWKHQCSHLWLV